MEPSEMYVSCPACGDEESDIHQRMKLLRTLCASVLLTMPLMWGMRPHIQLLFATAVQFWPGSYFYRGACRALKEGILVVSEREFYNADTAEEMTHAIRTEESLMGLTTPSVHSDANDAKGRGLSGFRRRRKQRWQRIEQHIQRRFEWRETLEERRCRCEEIQESGLIPDLHSRYFTADFPYGLTVIMRSLPMRCCG